MSLGVMHLSFFSSLIVLLNKPEKSAPQSLKSDFNHTFKVQFLPNESNKLSYNLEAEETEA